MTRRRLHAVKILLLAFTAIAVSTMPIWGIRTFLYVFGAIVAVVGLFAFGMFLALFDLWLGFARFKRWTSEQARRLRSRRARVRLLHSPDVVCGDRMCRQCYGGEIDAGRSFLLDVFEDEVRR
jgi:hypothetical protein